MMQLKPENLMIGLKKLEQLYNQVIDFSAHSNQAVFHLTDQYLFHEILHNFGPILDRQKAEVNLDSLYTVSLHLPTHSLIIANKGATLFCLSPLSKTPYITRHIGCAIYRPKLGVEFVNIGLVGNIYDGKVVLRSESACTPSFIFGSQRCNCAHQWDSIKEVAARINQVSVPKDLGEDDFEKWVQKQFINDGMKHYPLHNGRGLILMHIDTQNGMGSGFTAERFAFDLFTVSSLRHRGEYSAEQIHDRTMLEGFKAIGVNPDPRSEQDNIGYKVTHILLDWLDCNKKLMVLSNNPKKISMLKQHGYTVDRIKTLGEINKAGGREAKQRGSEFLHWDINEEEVSFQDEVERLIEEIDQISN